ncbi:Unknown protein sequence [Pseudomonas syringae pv. cilantro]|uniref:Uncharacterized protein n=1 Tax=Pseudomonas syringae pv. cilantro TaxID=81035 RepID=A0A0N0GHV7_PSESX|nr:Unknown protein sequence [Pseudomonas syringae pv. cilantro]
MVSARAQVSVTQVQASSYRLQANDVPAWVNRLTTHSLAA